MAADGERESKSSLEHDVLELREGDSDRFEKDRDELRLNRNRSIG